MVCTIVQRYPKAAVVLAEAVGVPLPEHDEVAAVGEALRPDMFERLRELESFREYEAKVKAEGKAETEVAIRAEDLKDFLVLRGDAPSGHALRTISACSDVDVLAAWLKRAYLGETSAQLFPELGAPSVGQEKI